MDGRIAGTSDSCQVWHKKILAMDHGTTRPGTLLTGFCASHLADDVSIEVNEDGSKERLEAIMGLLDELASKVTDTPSTGSTEQTSGLAGGIMHMLNSHPGGLPGLVQMFQEKGLGGIVNSWVGTGQNLPISAEQIRGVLGSEQVQQFATKAGISPDLATSKLAELLPVVVDKLTPEGKIPEGGGLLQQALGFFAQR